MSAVAVADDVVVVVVAVAVVARSRMSCSSVGKTKTLPSALPVAMSSGLSAEGEGRRMAALT